MKKKYQNKTAQEIQDDIFKKMSADRKIEIGSLLWRLGKSLNSNKINYATRRPKASFGKYS
jgi:uncharacterized protein YuzE|tara:strand:- start:997 stop:1179 length:183 start_codon:yes stop_codon:yes gene_type:complete